MRSGDEDIFEWRRFDKLLYGGSVNLEREDVCLFFMDRSPGGFSVSRANSLVSNLKITKADLERNPNRAHYKSEAIEQCAQDMANYFLRHASKVLDIGRRAEDLLLVPIPPSECRDDAAYDDRMVLVCDKVSQRTGIPFANCLFSKKTAEKSHASPKRRDIGKIYGNIGFDVAAIFSHPQTVVLVDDVLTSGAHFKACQQVLRGWNADVEVMGLFWAKQKNDPDYEYGCVRGDFSEFFG